MKSIIVVQLALILVSPSLVNCNGSKESSQKEASSTSKSNTNGYSDLDLLFSDFIRILKEDDKLKLKDYCYKIKPDASTVEYMKNNQFSYRGIPENYADKQNIISENELYFNQLSSFQESLKKNGELKNLKYIGREKGGEVIVNHILTISPSAKSFPDIRGTETSILINSGNDTIRCKLGEMLNINGAWKSFTEAKIMR